MISVSIVANLFSLRQKATCSNYRPLSAPRGLSGAEWIELFKFLVHPMRVGALCPLNLCFRSVTFDSCAALSHPIAHIQCGPMCWGSKKEVSVITTAHTALCTSQTPLTLQLRPSAFSGNCFSLCSSRQKRTSFLYFMFFSLSHYLEKVKACFTENALQQSLVWNISVDIKEAVAFSDKLQTTFWKEVSKMFRNILRDSQFSHQSC